VEELESLVARLSTRAPGGKARKGKAKPRRKA